MKHVVLGKSDNYEKSLDKLTAEGIALCIDEKQAIEFILKQKLHLI
ncbi:hypothetical protein L6303_01225 [archaeon]|nr:hypothetical protein [Nanoarchaeota archaeon]MCG2723340.1 hypothetical protein [archaeon]